MIHKVATASGQRTANSLLERYRSVRSFTERLCDPLEAEDCVLQSMPDASPTRWHLAHTTWFFETFFLPKARPGHKSYDPAFEYLFNSYYNTIGDQFPRPRRGLISRPTVSEVFAYRRHVDAEVEAALATDEASARPDLLGVIEIGLQHEQQHQELILTDIKHALSFNPLHPVYRQARERPETGSTLSGRWIGKEGGVHWLGHEGDGFAFDNECPRHRVHLESFEIGSRPVTNAEYIEFIEDAGYRRPELWLSAGWQEVCDRGWTAPLYWEERDGARHHFTLAGLQPIDPAEPVCHVSYYEADAFARWSGARLATEAEWETAAQGVEIDGNFAEDGLLHPAPARADSTGPFRQLFGDVWEWTSSAYAPYPGFAPLDGALGEYNGKFMCNQYVLRGGSCATSSTHIRRTYRNFFPPDARWQFTGIRLARYR